MIWSSNMEEMGREDSISDKRLLKEGTKMFGSSIPYHICKNLLTQIIA
jgi:hypothetical protein